MIEASIRAKHHNILGSQGNVIQGENNLKIILFLSGQILLIGMKMKMKFR